MSNEELLGFLIDDIKGIKITQECIKTTQTNILVEIATLKVKSGIWGLAGSLIPTIGAVLFVLLSKG